MLDWLLEKRGELSQAKVAEKAGITQQQYSHIELGIRSPSVKTAMRLGAALGFDWTRFFSTENAQREAPQ